MNIQYAKFLIEKTRKDYDEIAEEFSATRRTMWPEFADFDKFVSDGDNVLDIGCGNGKLFVFLAGKQKRFSYCGLDVSKKLIAFAESLAHKAIYEAQNRSVIAEFKTYDGVNIPYEEASFDVIFCLATLPHLPGREIQIKFLENIRKVAKPGAKLIITCWNLWQFKFISFQLKMIVNCIIDRILGNLPRYPYEQNNKKQLKKDSVFVSILSLITGLGNGGRYDWGDFYIPWKKRNSAPVLRYYHGFTVPELNSILKEAGWKVEDIGFKTRNGSKNFNIYAVARRI